MTSFYRKRWIKLPLLSYIKTSCQLSNLIRSHSSLLHLLLIRSGTYNKVHAYNSHSELIHCGCHVRTKWNWQKLYHLSVHNYHSRQRLQCACACERTHVCVCACMCILWIAFCFALCISSDIKTALRNTIPHAVAKWMIRYSCVVMRKLNQENVQKFTNCKGCDAWNRSLCLWMCWIYILLLMLKLRHQWWWFDLTGSWAYFGFSAANAHLHHSLSLLLNYAYTILISCSACIVLSAEKRNKRSHHETL